MVRLRILLPLLVLTGTATLLAGPPLTFLDEFCDPYYPGTDFPKLITPQWVGDEDVDAVITLGIDDMRDPAHYEAYLRPILNRLKQIDGRAPVSIFTCNVDPQHEQLQRWLDEGLSLEVHTIDHPCPCLQNNSFATAKRTVDRCVDLLSSIRGNKPVAFRFPCCDSQNTPSPRAYVEILNRATENGNFLQASSSVMCVFTPDDLELPKSLTTDAEGGLRFGKYIPFPSFVNKIENYPYPYLIGGRCWEFPGTIPDDWQGQNLNQPNNPATVEDLIAAIDATVIKKGIANIVFHPHGWIRAQQIVQVIDHVETKYGKRVKFLTFRDCVERINQHLLLGQPVRSVGGEENGVRLLDINDDGYVDVLIGNRQRQLARIWQPDDRGWLDVQSPLQFWSNDTDGRRINQGVRFGVFSDSGQVDAYVNRAGHQAIYRFAGDHFDRLPIPPGLEGIAPAQSPTDNGIRLRDLDQDGISEVLVGNLRQQQIFQRSDSGNWSPTQSLPATIVDARGQDNGVRFVDLDRDGFDDFVVSNDQQSAVHLFDPDSGGFTRRVGPAEEMLKIVSGGMNHGAWFADGHQWLQNEGTNRLPDGVDRRTFAELIGNTEPEPRTPQQSLRSIHVGKGLRMELVASEPLVVDPVALDWADDGRLWVVEMNDYPQGLDDQGQPGGRIRLLTDVNGDGTYDQSTLFLEDIPFPTGVMQWRDGILITAAPDILFARDHDGDGRADSVEPLYSGFGEGNQQHRVNGFAWGLDNWVYLANGDSGGTIRSHKLGTSVHLRGRDLRIDPDSGRLDAQAGQTQFGRQRDDHGNWFGCNNLVPVRHYILGDHYVRRNPLLAAPSLSRDVAPNGATQVFPISNVLSHWSDYIPPGPGQPHRFTAAAGVTVYRDSVLGASYYGNTFTCDAVLNAVHRRTLKPNGVTFVSDRPAEESKREFLASTDPWFRPTTATTGPDGALYITDMYRLVIEHPEWIDDQHEQEIFVRAGHDRGRIYRVVPARGELRKVPRWNKLSVSELVRTFNSPNGRVRDTTQRLLVQRADPASIRPLRQMVLSNDDSLARLHALCTLDGLDRVDLEVLSSALRDDDPTVCRNAIRIAERAPNADRPKILSLLIPLANHTDAQVRLQLACSLGYWSDRQATETLAKLAADEDSYLRSAALSSVSAQTMPDFYAAVVALGPAADSLRPTMIAMVSQGGGDLADQILQGFVDQINVDSISRDELHELTRMLSARGKSSAKLLDKTLRRLATIADREYARLTAQPDAETEDPNHTSAAIRFLSTVPSDPISERRDALLNWIDSQQPPQVQLAAIATIDDRTEERSVRGLLRRLPELSPTIRAAALDQLLQRKRHCVTLLTEIDRNDLNLQLIGPTHRQSLLLHSDRQVKSAATRLLGSIQNNNKAKLIDSYRTADVSPNVELGRRLFAKHCATCHQVDQTGHGVGPDLASLTNRSTAALLVAILDPNRAVEDKYRSFRVLTTDGRTETGMIGDEAGASLTLVGPDSKRTVILRRDIERVIDSGVSLMPEGLEQEITPEDMSHLLAYLSRLGPPPRKFAGNHPAIIAASSDGRLKLAAQASRIYGPDLVFEQRYQNIGFWSHAEARVEWTLDVSRPGRYQVWLDYACANGTAGNQYRLKIADQVMVGVVRGTGTWNDYEQLQVGEVLLPNGSTSASITANGPLNQFLFDLRSIELIPADK